MARRHPVDTIRSLGRGIAPAHRLRPSTTPSALTLVPPSVRLDGAPPSIELPDPEALLWLVGFLGLSAFFSVLRAALQFSVPDRILARVPGERARRRLAPLLERADLLASSASILKITCDLAFVTFLVGVIAQDGPPPWPELLLAIGIGAPVLLLFTLALPNAIARHRGDGLVQRVLPTFHVLQLPLGLVVLAINEVRKALMRILHLPEHSPSARHILEDLREVLEDNAGSRVLDPTEREIIENVMEFRDVDVAAVMTPRTEVHGVELGNSIEDALRVFAESGHSRIPVYEETIDRIVGVVTALDVAKTVSAGQLAQTRLRDVMRPVRFVPETKRISELLTEFRAKKQKMAIVLDEYGGTAGLVTMTDVVSEIIGDILDEFEDAAEPIRRLDDGRVEIEAAVHVSEVNEALGIHIPEEEDFETLGGFVLAELGHFPKKGEKFVRDEVEFAVVEASDRRVLKVLVSKSA